MIVLGDALTRSKPMERNADAQAEVDVAASKLSLYQFYACPFCVKTRRAIRRLALPIEFRDAQNNAQFRSELEAEGGRIKVPCLRIEDEDEDGVQWMILSPTWRNVLVLSLNQSAKCENDANPNYTRRIPLSLTTPSSTKE